MRDCLDRLGLDADGSGVVNCFTVTCAGRVLAGVFVDRIVCRLPNDLEGKIEWDVLANNLFGPVPVSSIIDQVLAYLGPVGDPESDLYGLTNIIDILTFPLPLLPLDFAQRPSGIRNQQPPFPNPTRRFAHNSPSIQIFFIPILSFLHSIQRRIMAWDMGRLRSRDKHHVRLSI